MHSQHCNDLFKNIVMICKKYTTGYVEKISKNKPEVFWDCVKSTFLTPMSHGPDSFQLRYLFLYIIPLQELESIQ